ncbi:MAG TPA: hypothetical protein PKE69_07985 [Pyrinomonadaceae bacterium]|nr:hypothetical protein [Pyrinomonadaceae bacterium]
MISILLSFALLLQKPTEPKESRIVSSFEGKNSAATISYALFTKQQVKVKGENFPVKFERDLETSLEIQEIPIIWLEYTDEKNQTTKVEIPKKAQEFIKKRWLNTLRYSYQNQSTNDRETKVNIQENYLNDAAVYATTIVDFEIVTPFGKRNISQEEAFEIMRIVAGLAINRYEELQNMSLQVNLQKNYE